MKRDDIRSIPVDNGQVLHIRLNRRGDGKSDVELVMTESIGRVAVPCTAVSELVRVLKRVAAAE